MNESECPVKGASERDPTLFPPCGATAGGYHVEDARTELIYAGILFLDIQLPKLWEIMSFFPPTFRFAGLHYNWAETVCPLEQGRGKLKVWETGKVLSSIHYILRCWLGGSQSPLVPPQCLASCLTAHVLTEHDSLAQPRRA